MSDIQTLENEVSADRARLAQTLDALTDTVAPQRLAQEATTAANDVGNVLAQKAWGTVRDNPAGGLLIVAGLGLLASGSERRAAPAPLQDSTAVPAIKAMVGFDARVAAADAEMKTAMTGEMEERPSASKMKAALHNGLEYLPTAAKKRIVTAREAAIAAQESIERQTRRAARKTKGFVYEQPLTAGALALGFGVLAASLLPGTRREDALLGARRDALMADARNALEEEVLKAKAKAEGAIAATTGTNVHDLRAS